jgi:acetyltransferase-like isoleucine patch superfamily enzyme
MSNFLVFAYRKLRALSARVAASKRANEALQKFAKANPTCRIGSSNLNSVVLGEFVTILGDASLDKVTIFDFSYISNGSTLSNVEIGKFCSIGPNIQIGLGPHPSRIFVSTYPAFYSANNEGCRLKFRNNKIFDDLIPKTCIGNDVWIGANAIIPGGIQIGTGAIVAAGAVVVKDVPPYAIVGGSPAKIIRYRFTEEQIKSLLESAWWDWPVEKIRQRVDDFSDIEKFQASIGREEC